MKTMACSFRMAVTVLIFASVFISPAAYGQEIVEPARFESVDYSGSVGYSNPSVEPSYVAPPVMDYVTAPAPTVSDTATAGLFDSSSVGLSYSQPAIAPIDSYSAGVSYDLSRAEVVTENNIFAQGATVGMESMRIENPTVNSVAIENPSITEVASINTGSYGASNIVTGPEFAMGIETPVSASIDTGTYGAASAALEPAVSPIETPSIAPVVIEQPYTPAYNPASEVASVDTGSFGAGSMAAPEYPMVPSVDQGFVPVAVPERPVS